MSELTINSATEKLQRENKALHIQLRTHIDLLQTLLERLNAHADGTSDTTALEKFCNEMVGLYNGVLLKDTRTIVQERDKLRAELLATQVQSEKLRETLKNIHADAVCIFSYQQHLISCDHANPTTKESWCFPCRQRNQIEQALALTSATALAPIVEALKDVLSSHRNQFMEQAKPGECVICDKLNYVLQLLGVKEEK